MSTQISCVAPASVPAVDMVSSKRLDIVVKYLFARELLESRRNDFKKGIYKDLYIRHILMRTLGVEPIDKFSLEVAQQKNTVDDYVNSFKNLIKSISENGFDSSFPVPIDKQGQLGNGAHRLAAAVALNQSVFIQDIDRGFGWDFDWFNKQGFSVEDKQRILRGFVELKCKDCSVFVVYQPAVKFLGNIKAIISKRFDIVGTVSLDFENNFRLFKNIILDIYDRNISKSESIREAILQKTDVLLADKLNLTVIVACVKDRSDQTQVGQLTKNIKEEIRVLLNHQIPKEIFCTIHSSDCEEECLYLSNILLSPNHIKQTSLRLELDDNKWLTGAVRKLPGILNQYRIEENEVCVVGSSVAKAYGIDSHKESDIDLVVLQSKRTKPEPYQLHELVDIATSSRHANRSLDIDDEILIENPEYHFYHRGIKFANLEVLRSRLGKREKDVLLRRKIDLLFNFMGGVDQLRILNSRIQAEQENRRMRNAKKGRFKKFVKKIKQMFVK